MAKDILIGGADPIASAESYIEAISMESSSVQLYMEAEMGEQGFEPAPTGVVVGTPLGNSTPSNSAEGQTPLSVSGAAEVAATKVDDVVAPAAEGGYVDAQTGTPAPVCESGCGESGSHDDSGESAIANINSVSDAIAAAAEEHGVEVSSVEVTENSDGTATVEVEVAPESTPAVEGEATPAPAAEETVEAAPAETTEVSSEGHDDSGESAISAISESHDSVGAAAEEHGVSGGEATPAEEPAVEEEKSAEETEEKKEEEDKE